MDLKRIACTPPTLVSSQMTVLDAVRLMASAPADAVLIVDDENRIQGIFTERDNLMRVTLKELNSRVTPLAKVMTAPVVTATLSASVDEALETMFRNHFRHLPIVDEDNRAIGTISARDLLMRRIGEKEAALQTLEAYVMSGGPG